MADRPLQGMGVLVTRPRAQAAELVDAIHSNGGTAIVFPVIEILPQEAASIAAELALLPKPDIAIYVSRNAVRFGLTYTAGALLAATGPSTAAAIREAGRDVSIEPEEGYDSESLLRQPQLQAVAGKQVLIVRGGAGRELLADTLRERGAIVNYLSVYERVLPAGSPESLAAVEAAWRAGTIGAITVMSVQSLKNLLELLPDDCMQGLGDVPLVTPAVRVIKEALERCPHVKPVLATGPAAADMVQAIISLLRTEPGKAP